MGVAGRLNLSVDDFVFRSKHREHHSLSSVHSALATTTLRWDKESSEFPSDAKAVHAAHWTSSSVNKRQTWVALIWWTNLLAPGQSTAWHLDAELCWDNAEDSNCLWDPYPWAAVLRLGLGLGATVIFPHCLTSLHSHSRSVGEKWCSQEKIPAFSIHANKHIDCPAPNPMLKPLTTAQINTLSKGSFEISQSLKNSNGVMSEASNVRHALIHPGSVLGSN